jgi:hypothetical protein
MALSRRYRAETFIGKLKAEIWQQFRPFLTMEAHGAQQSNSKRVNERIPWEPMGQAIQNLPQIEVPR